MTKEEFATTYLDSLSRRYNTVKFTLNPDLTINSKKNGKDYKHFIDNAYIEYTFEPDSANSIISRYIASTTDLYSKQNNILIHNIIPTIKAAESVDELISLYKERKAPDIIYRKYNSQLIVIYAEDSKSSIKYLTRESFKQLSISEDSLNSIALKNLKRMLPAIERQGTSGLYMITAGGNYEASLLLLPDLWKKENFPVDGNFVIAIPNRDMLLVTGDKNKAAISKIREIATNSYTSGSYPVSESLYRWTGKTFEKYNY